MDLFCGAGGAAVGYHRAGFDIVGIDIEPQPDYPFPFIQADALAPPVDLDAFAVLHASPPCQGYTPMNNRWGSDTPTLIPQLRRMLRGRRYVIENVVGAGRHLNTTFRLCGSSFGLSTWRHRLFETSDLIMGPPKCRHIGSPTSVYGRPDGRRLFTRADGSELSAWGSVAEGQQALGIDWTDDPDGIREAIPPAYTEWIGERLLETI